MKVIEAERVQLRGTVAKIRSWLPQGSLLKTEEWERRHRAITIILWAHAVFVFAYGIEQGFGFLHMSVESTTVVAAALLASRPLGRAWRSCAATVGLLMSSALLVNLSGGMIEAHFHFFVIIGLLSLYQDWLPFLLAIGFVVAHHGLIGWLDPRGVFNHPGAWRHPWTWALIHGLFVLAASVAYVVSWRANEKARQDAEDSFQRLRSSEERFKSLVQNAPDAISVVGPHGKIVYTSESSLGVIGYEPDELIGREVLSLTHPDDVERTRAVLNDLMEAPGSFAVVELRAKHKDGSWRWLEVRWTNLMEDPNVNGIVVNYRDVDERKKLESKLTHQAFHDPLTGLPNRLYFMDRVEKILARVRRTGKPAAVLFIDLDNFKPINDTLGHNVGDQVLVEIGRRLQETLRSVDTASRLGGDEFAVLIEDVQSDKVDVVVERICKTLNAPIITGGQSLDVKASVGICVTETGAETASELVRNADLAMYLAKSNGRGRQELFEPSMLSEAVGAMQLKNDLKDAIDHDRLSLYFQPVVDLRSGGVVGVEALARWFHPGKGIIPPSEFIPIAEETGLIVPLGAQLLRKACESMGRLGEADMRWADLWMSFNVSSRELRNPDFVSEVRKTLRLKRFAPRRLVLEVTESLLMEDVENAREQLASLHANGVRIAIDDFGTGQSSLSLIGTLPATVLKIDRVFVANLDQASLDRALTQTMLNLANAVRMDVVAEGIERVEQYEILRDIGCRWGQGYLMSPPLDEKSLRAFLSDHSGRGAALWSGDASLEGVST
jgi:diguanylate cyclase (GGDEF)-like protein/PAS domain S-box-containing protein